MQIKEIKITEELMNALIDKFFNALLINQERTLENAKRSFDASTGKISQFHPSLQPIKPINVTINATLDINEMDIQKYFDEWRDEIMKSCPEVPYISLVADNAENDLQIYINQCEDNKVTCEDISCKSLWYKVINEKYVFENRKHLL